MSANEVKVSKSPPYHPQSNGLAERGVRSAKDVLKKYLLDEKCKPLSMARKLNRFLINYRNTPSTVTNRTPSSMIFSYTPRTLTNVVNPQKVQVESTNAKPMIVRKEPIIQVSHESAKMKSFNAGEKVLYRNHFKDIIRWIPAIVLQKLSPLTYLISLEGNVRMVHSNQIRYSDLSDKFHPSVPVHPVKANNDDESSGYEDTSSEDGNPVQVPATIRVTPPSKNKKKTSKRRRSETKSPKVRRSNRLRGQPKLKYPK